LIPYSNFESNEFGVIAFDANYEKGEIFAAASRKRSASVGRATHVVEVCVVLTDRGEGDTMAPALRKRPAVELTLASTSDLGRDDPIL
jgi:hypothetical protein